jgi:hypothetical protein
VTPRPGLDHQLRRGVTPRGTGLGNLYAVELPSLRAVIGGVLVLAVAAGFEFEYSWLFLGGSVLFLAWCGYLLMAPDEH